MARPHAILSLAALLVTLTAVGTMAAGPYVWRGVYMVCPTGPCASLYYGVPFYCYDDSIVPPESAPIVGSNLCTSPQPSETQVCTGPECAVWEDTPWTTTCPCGTRVQTRDKPKCLALGNWVFDSRCLSRFPLPEVTRSCTASPACFYWRLGSWGTCGPSCSASQTWTRTVDCYEIGGTPVADESLCPSPKPLLTDSCTAACDNCYLADMRITDQLPFTFVRNWLGFNVEVPNSVTAVTASATPEDSGATMVWSPQSVSGLVYGWVQTVRVRVTAANGYDWREYTITVIRQANANPYLGALTATVGTFNPALALDTVFAYTLTVPWASTSTLMFAGYAYPHAGTPSFNPTNQPDSLLPLPSARTVTINSVSESGIFQAYTITVKRDFSPIAALTYFYIVTDWSQNLEPAFDANLHSYHLSALSYIPNGRIHYQSYTFTFLAAFDSGVRTTSTYTLTSDSGTVGPVAFTSGSYTINMGEGIHTFTVKTWSPDGTNTVENVAIWERQNTDSKLSSITWSSGVIDRPWVIGTSLVEYYTIEVDLSTTSFTMYPIVRHPYAKGSYSFDNTAYVAFSPSQPIPWLSLPTVRDYPLVIHVEADWTFINSLWQFTIRRKTTGGTGVYHCVANGCDCAAGVEKLSCSCLYYDNCVGYDYTASHCWCHTECVYPAFDACPVTCGPFMQVRTPTCKYEDNAPAALGMCGGTCWDTTQICATNHCYEWSISDWSTCGTSCGTSTQWRTITCLDNSLGGIETDDQYCIDQLGALPPLRSCTDHTACSWTLSPWDTCSQSCGDGTQARTQGCIDGSSSTSPNADCQLALGAPSDPLIQSCNLAKCFWWDYTGAWTTCSTTCGLGSQTKVPVCRTITDNTAVAQSGCEGEYGYASPPVQSCNVAGCYQWSYSSFDTCSESCGPGTQTRVATCIDLSAGSSTVDDSLCTGQLGAPTLPLEQDCSIINCFAWQTDPDWGVCSVSCSSGTHTRHVWCQDTTLDALAGAESSCLLTKPDMIESCYTACTNNFLSTFTISNQLDFPFVQTTMDYFVQIPWEYTTSSGTAVKEDPTATLTWTTQTVNGLVYPAPTFDIVCTVTSQAGVPRVYTVTVQRRPSYNAFLSALTADVGTWGEPVTLTSLQSVFTYTLTVPNIYSSVVFDATLADPTATITGWSPSATPTNLIVLPDTTTATVTTLAQDGTRTYTYTIIISRPQSTISTLAGLTITAATTARMIPSFDTAQLGYSFSGRLGPDIASVILTATLEDDTARDMTYTLTYQGGTVGPIAIADHTATTVAIFEGALTLTIKIISQDGSTETVYACELIKVSSDSKLLGLTQSAGSIDTPLMPGTNAVESYLLTVPFGATLLTLTPIMRNVFATGVYSFQGTTGSQFSVAKPIPALSLPTIGDFSLVLRITSEDLSTLTTYSLTIHRQSNDARLATLGAQIDFTSPFQADAHPAYKVNIPTSFASLQLTASAAHALATVRVKIGSADYVPVVGGAVTIPVGSISWSDTDILVQVVAEDGTDGLVTTLTAHRLSSDASLNGFDNTAQVVTITSALEYTLTVASTIQTFNVRPSTTSRWATITYLYGAGTTDLPYTSGEAIVGLALAIGVNTLKLAVLSEDGASTKKYTFTVYRNSGSAALIALTISTADGSVGTSPSFLPTVGAYTATVGSTVAKVIVSATPLSAGTIVTYAVAHTETPETATFTSATNLAVSVGINYIFVRCRSEDSVTVSYYTVKVSRMSADSSLRALSTTAAASLDPSFMSDTTAYTVNVPPASTTVDISFTRSYALSTITWSWNSGLPIVATGDANRITAALSMGSNTLVLTVMSEDATSQTDYSLVVFRQSSDSTLASLSISGGDLQPLFTPDVKAYTITLTDGTKTIIAIPSVIPSQVHYKTDAGSFLPLPLVGTGISFSTGSTELLVRVTAQDGSLGTYTITVRRLSSDSQITSVTAPWTYISPAAWSATVMNYRVSVGANTAAITLAFIKANSNMATTFTISPGSSTETPFGDSMTNLALQAGDNILQLTCLSEDTTSTTVYTIVINRISGVATLSGLLPRFGTFDLAFTPTVLSYTLTLASTIDTFALTPVPSQPRSVMSASATLGGVQLPAANSYSVVSSGATTPTVNIPFGNSLVTVLVVAEDGTSQSLYQVTVHRISNDATLSALTSPAGPLVAVGDHHFRLDVNAATTTVAILATSTYSLAMRSYAINGEMTYTSLTASTIPAGVIQLSAGLTVVVIRVVAEDATTTILTTIDIHRVSRDADLKLVTLAPALPGFVFTSGVTTYRMRVTFDTTLFGWSAQTSSSLASSLRFVWNTNEPIASVNPASVIGQTGALAVGDNSLIITVTAEDGTTTRIYTLTVHRINSDAKLTGLAIAPNALTFVFSPAQFSYPTISVGSGVDTLWVTATTAANSLSTIAIASGPVNSALSQAVALASAVPSQPIALPTGTTQIVLTVVAEDGVTTLTYTVFIRRVSTDCTLAGFAMSPAGFGFAPTFLPGQRSYTNSVPNSVSTVSFSALKNHPDSTIILSTCIGDVADWAELAQLTSGITSTPSAAPVGHSNWRARVTAEDGISLCDYMVDISRLSSDASLSTGGLQVASIGLDGTSTNRALSPAFSPAHHEYSLDVSNSIQALTIRITASDPTSTVVYTNETTASRVLSSAAPASRDLPLETVSDRIALAAGATFVTVTVTSGDFSAKTIYSITINRVSDLISVALTGLPNGLPVATLPSFTPGQPILVASVAYKVESFCVSTVHTSNEAFMIAGTGATQSGFVTLPASGPACSGPLPLNIGEKSTFALNSPLDGTVIAIEVTRADKVMSGLMFTVTAGSSLFSAPSPPFKSSIRAYSGSTAFISASIQLLATFSDGTASVSIISNSAIQFVSVRSGEAVTLPLLVGANLVVLTHSLDGIYTTTIVRSQADVTTVRLDGDGQSQFGLELSPDFVGGVLTYTAAVPAVVTKITAVAFFVTPQSLSFTHTLSGGGFPAVMQTGVASAALTLPTGSTTLTLSSVRDGIYTIVLTRGEADVGGVVLTGQHWDGSSQPLVIAPTFTPGNLVQRIVALVPKAIESFTITVSFKQVGTVSYTLPGWTTSIGLRSGIASSPIPLAVGLNSVSVTSTQDGIYPFTITRAAADVSSVVMSGVAQEGTVRGLTLVPAVFKVDTRSYFVSVPYRTHRVVFTASFATPGSVSLSGGGAPHLFDLVNSVMSDSVSIVVGANTFTLFSDGLDGSYAYVVTRAVPNVASVAFTLFSATEASWLSTALVFDSAKYAYSARVPYAVSALNMVAAFATPTSATVSINDGSALSLISGTARALALEVGTNTIAFVSEADGIYVLTLERAPVDVSSIEVTGFSNSKAQLYAPAVPNNLVPVYTLETMQYELTVGSAVKSVQIRVVTGTDLINVLSLSQDGATVQALSLESGTSTVLLGIQPGMNVFKIDSLLDGAFTIRVTQSPPDILGIKLVESAAPSVQLISVPSFTSGVYEYLYDVPFGVDSVEFALIHAQPDSDVRLHDAGGMYQPSSVVAIDDVTTSSFAASQLQVAPLMNVFILSSQYDADVTVTVRRAVPDIVTIQLQIETLGTDSLDALPSTTILTPTILQPAFAASVREYTLSLPYTASALQIAAVFATAGSVAVQIVDLDLPANLISGEHSSGLPLKVGTQRVSILSQLDREYVITVTRAAGDVKSIVAQGVNRDCDQVSSSPCTPTTIALSPAFSVATVDVGDGALQYRIHVPWLTTQLQLNAVFTTPYSLMLIDPQQAVDSLTSNAWSRWLNLPVPDATPIDSSQSSINTIYSLSSTQDGLYSIEVRRAFPDLQQISLTVDGVTCSESSSSLLQLVLLAPAINSPGQAMGKRKSVNLQAFSPLDSAPQVVFLPDVYSYSLSVPYSVESVSLDVEFGVQWPENSVGLNQANSVLTDATVFLPLRPGQSTSGIALAVGTNAFTFRSAADGVYTVVVTRAESSITGISLRGLAGSDASSSLATTFPLTPEFIRGKATWYSLSLPPAVTSLIWTVTSIDSADQLAVIDPNSDRTELAAGMVSDSTFAVSNSALEFAFKLLSQNDGCYSLTVSRSAAPALESVLLTQQLSLGITAAQAIQSLQHDQLGDSASLAFASTLGLALDGVAMPADTAFDPSTGLLATPVALSPSFIGGWLGPYSARVSSASSSIKLRLSFRSDVTAAPSCTLNGNPFKLQTEIVASCAPGAIISMSVSDSGECDTEVPLQIGVNTLACVTTDGVYEFKLTRGSGAWEAISMPETIYVNELVRLTLGESGLSQVDELNVNLLSSAGSLAPSLWQFGIASGNSGASLAEFSFRAPALVDEPTLVYLTYVADGSSAWQFPPAEITTMTVLPQASVSITGVAAEYYSGQQTAPIFVGPTEAPRRGSSLIATISLIDVVNGVTLDAAIATLTFTTLNFGPQSFQFTMPIRSERSTPFRLEFALAGDVEHYTPVTAQLLTVISQSSFVLTGLPPSIYVSKTAQLALAPSVAPYQDISLRVRVDGGGSLGSVVDSNTVSADSSELVLHFAAGSTASVPVVYIAPLTFSGDGIFTLSFVVIESSDSQYLPIPSRTSQLIAPVSVFIEGAPQSILNREVSAPITLRIAATPLSEVTYILRTSLADVKFSPSTLAFSAGGVLSQTFTVSAPYWYQANSFINVDLIVIGPDADMFASVPSGLAVHIELEQQAPTVDQVSFYLRASDGKVLLLSAGLSPFIGNTFQYAYDLAVAVMDPAQATSASQSTKQESVVQSMSGMISRFFAADTAGYSSSNVSLAVLPVFGSGEVMLSVNYAVDATDTLLAGSTAHHTLKSGVRSPWIPLVPGKQAFKVQSSLDGDYTFAFKQTLITNPAACLSQANATVFGLPTESFIQPGVSVPVTQLIPTEGASAPPFLICATVPDVNNAAKLLSDASSQSVSTLAFSMSDSASTSWLFLLALVAYFGLSLAAGHNIGAGKALEEEVEHAQSMVAPVLAFLSLRSAAAAKNATLAHSERDRKLSLSTASVTSGTDVSQYEVSQSCASSTSDSASELSSAPTIQQPINNNNSVIPAALAHRLTLGLSMSSLVLILCICRGLSMLVYYYFFSSLSVPAVRLFTGLPHVLLPWILTTVMQQLPTLVHATLLSQQRHAHAVPSCFRSMPRLALGLLSALTVTMTTVYVYMIVATPPSGLQSLLDAAMLVCVALICIGQLTYLASSCLMLHQYMKVTSASAVPTAVAMIHMARTQAFDNEAGDNQATSLPIPSHALPKVTTAQVGAARRAFRQMALILLASSVCCGSLLLSVTWSNMYAQTYQQYALFQTVLEVAALAALMYTVHQALAAQRAQLQHFTDFGSSIFAEKQVEASRTQQSKLRRATTGSARTKRSQSPTRSESHTRSVSSSRAAGSVQSSSPPGALTPLSGSMSPISMIRSPLTLGAVNVADEDEEGSLFSLNVRALDLNLPGSPASVSRVSAGKAPSPLASPHSTSTTVSRRALDRIKSLNPNRRFGQLPVMHALPTSVPAQSDGNWHLIEPLPHPVAPEAAELQSNSSTPTPRSVSSNSSSPSSSSSRLSSKRATPISSPTIGPQLVSKRMISSRLPQLDQPPTESWTQ